MCVCVEEDGEGGTAGFQPYKPTLSCYWLFHGDSQVSVSVSVGYRLTFFILDAIAVDDSLINLS